MHQLILSKEQFRTMKRIRESKRIHFPNTNELNEAHKKLRPAVSSVMDGRGVYVDYYDLITDTATSLLTSLDDQGIPNNKFYNEAVLKGCVRYIFASLFCMSKREHFGNNKKMFFISV